LRESLPPQVAQLSTDRRKQYFYPPSPVFPIVEKKPEEPEKQNELAE
jgi:hypothetical protein